MIRLVETIGWRVSQCLILWWIALGVAWLSDATTLTTTELLRLAMLGVAVMVTIMLACAVGSGVWIALTAISRTWRGQRPPGEKTKSARD